MAWKRNLRDNLYGEGTWWDLPTLFSDSLDLLLGFKTAQSNHLLTVIIVSLAYLLEDGPELILQYYWVDRYAGMKYEYPDGTSFS